MSEDNVTRFTRDELAAKVAGTIPNGAYVNLGIGIPTMVANHLPADSGVMLHSENGMLGTGPEKKTGMDLDLINAGRVPVTTVPGASFFNHADSFAMIRGGHIDVSVIGAFQVAVNGDLANWSTGEPGDIPAVGGAMDLAVGAKKVIVIMDLFDKKGTCKLVEKCTYPLTGKACVSSVFSDYGVFDITDKGVVVKEVAPGLTKEALQTKMGIALL